MQDNTVKASSEYQSNSGLDKWHDFWQAATPNIFNWFQWAAVLGLLSYVNTKHPSVALSLLIGLGYLSLIFYFGGFFTRRSVEITWIKNKRSAFFVWQLMAILLGCATSFLIEHAVSGFATATP